MPRAKNLNISKIAFARHLHVETGLIWIDLVQSFVSRLGGKSKKLHRTSKILNKTKANLIREYPIMSKGTNAIMTESNPWTVFFSESEVGNFKFP